MDEKLIIKTIAQINEKVKSQMWMDFEIGKFNGFELEVEGGIDLTYRRRYINILFSDIDYVCLKSDWKTDEISGDFLRLATESDILELKEKFTINTGGCKVFIFNSEEGGYLFVAAKEISFKIDKDAVTVDI